MQILGINLTLLNGLKLAGSNAPLHPKRGQLTCESPPSLHQPPSTHFNYHPNPQIPRPSQPTHITMDVRLPSPSSSPTASNLQLTPHPTPAPPALHHLLKTPRPLPHPHLPTTPPHPFPHLPRLPLLPLNPNPPLTLLIPRPSRRAAANRDLALFTRSGETP